MRFRCWIALPIIFFSQSSMACWLGGGHNYTKTTLAEYVFFGQMLEYEVGRHYAIAKVRVDEIVIGANMGAEETIIITENNLTDLENVLSMGEYLFIVVTVKNKNMSKIRMHMDKENPEWKWLLYSPCEDYYLFRKGDPAIVEILEAIENKSN